jgi:hypothetical protein
MRLRCALRAYMGFALGFPAGFALARADPFAFFTLPLAIFFWGLRTAPCHPHFRHLSKFNSAWVTTKAAAWFL